MKASGGWKGIAAAVSAALAAGCASGGGGGSTGSGGSGGGSGSGWKACNDSGPFIIYVPANGGKCPVPGEKDEPVGNYTPPPQDFTAWARSSSGVQTRVYGVSASIGDSTMSTVSTQPDQVVVQYYSAIGIAQGNFSLGSTGFSGKLYSGAGIGGQPAIEVNEAGWGQLPAMLVANPYQLGWEYQSFGAWNETVGGENRRYAMTFGAPTPAQSVPQTGTSSFVGKVGGYYLAADGARSVAVADMKMDVNFGTRSLAFTSTNTTLAPDRFNKSAAPNLNLSGSLSYAPGTNSFSGTLTSAGGTMSGQSNGRFYGPAAQELGGVFTLKAPSGTESFVGAYGGKR